jgi:putative flippase GtrA
MTTKGGSAESRRTLVRQLAGFVIVGAVNTVLTLCLYLGLHLFLPYWLAFTISFAAGVAFALFGNAKWVFAGTVKPASAAQFAAFYVFNYVASLAIVVVLVEGFEISSILAPLVAVALMLPINFTVNRFVLGQGRRGRNSSSVAQR